MKFQNRPTVAAVALASVALVGGTIALPGTTAAATPSEVSAKRIGEYEPNNNFSESPELPTAPFNAGLETPQDLDYYKFYVADPGTSVTLQVNDTTISKESHFGYIAIVDSDGDNIDSDSLYGASPLATVTATLDPGRYYLSIRTDSTTKIPTTYTVSSMGTFTPEATMVANCNAAKSDLKQALKALKKAKKQRKAADTKREVRRAKARIAKAKKARIIAQALRNQYCVVQ